MRRFVRENSLGLAAGLLFAMAFAGQIVAGFIEYNDDRQVLGDPPLALDSYLTSGHFTEAVFENWESEFLQMAVFVLLTTWLVQRGSPESRRPDNTKELVDIDPRDFAHDPEAPWPVRRGGWLLRLYENSLGLAFVLLFLLSWLGHAIGGFSDYAAEEALHHQPPPTFTDYVTSSRFLFESFQNWQSEFLAIGLMVWLAVYLRQRRSPQSNPVHAPHAESGH